ncbi:hypothetical protein [Streptomyces sp. NPDC047000]|uniref:hypothetical protein n=1 Tax=Streptomyces sp. NPDC047000 TaxID=3155474 RepID=UPI0033C2C5EE
MNGPEHYREAERRLLMAWEDDSTPQRSAHLVAEAQVHATLAQVAAFVSAQPIEGHDSRGGIPAEDWDQWTEAIYTGELPTVPKEI